MEELGYAPFGHKIFTYISVNHAPVSVYVCRARLLEQYFGIYIILCQKIIMALHYEVNFCTYALS